MQYFSTLSHDTYIPRTQQMGKPLGKTQMEQSGVATLYESM